VLPFLVWLSLPLETHTVAAVSTTGLLHHPLKLYREWARDDDGDGVREVHGTTAEGVGTGLRDLLRPFRGVSKWYLSQYVAVVEWSHNLKEVTADFLRAMMCPFTPEPT
jgi:transposase